MGKYRTHDSQWKLAAQRHLLQALEIYSGAPVRIDKFDTVTMNASLRSFKRSRTFEMRAVAVGDGLGGVMAPKHARAAVTMARFPRGLDSFFWAVEMASFDLDISDEEGDDVLHLMATFHYSLVRDGVSVLPVARVEPRLESIDGVFLGSVKSAFGRDLRDRKVTDVYIKGHSGYAEHFGAFPADLDVDFGNR